MPVSEKQKQHRNAWDRENMAVLGCKVRKDLAEAFREACEEEGTSPNAVFRKVIEAFLMEREKKKE